MKRFLLWASAICGLWVLSACGGGGRGVGTTVPPPILATHFSVVAPASVTAGTTFNFTVTALDATNATVTSYAGTVQFTSSDALAVRPPNSPLTNGIGTFSATLKISGNQTITATDMASASVTGTSNVITVASNQNSLTITSGAPPSGIVGAVYDTGPDISCLRGTPGCVCIIIVGGGIHCFIPQQGFPLAARGGVSPYKWSWTAKPGSSLPPGLAIGSAGARGSADSGIIGTPTTAGTFDVVVTVTDSSAPTAQSSASYPIEIINPPPAAADAKANESQVPHHHYKLVDLGTFGGPFGTINAEPTENFINNAGTIVGGADTSILTPVPGCYNPVNNNDCNISHAFAWRDDRLKDLGTLPGGDFSYAEGINNLGQIAGVSENDRLDPASGNPEFHAVLWENGVIKDLGTLGGTSSFAGSINDRGQIMGVSLNDIPDPFSVVGLGSTTTLTQTRGFLWQDGKMHDLGTLGGPDTFAIFLNHRGQVAGMSYTSDVPDPNSGFPPMDPFLWENGKITDLGNFGGTSPFGLFSGFISGLNDEGQVTGTMTLPGDQTSRAFLWDGKKLSDLGTLGGTFAVSYGINNAGEVVGMAALPGDNVFHAFLWRNRVMTDLGTVDGDACSTAQNANSVGQVVGSSQASDGMGSCVNLFTHAFLWENGGASVDLNSLIPPGSPVQLTTASYISDRGEIVGGGNPVGCTDNDTCNHVYVLIPCDENHPAVEGCDYSMAAPAATESRLNQLTNVPSMGSSTGPSTVLPLDAENGMRGFLGRQQRFGPPFRRQIS
jgi:probable HAF family extracellular repeat protein